MSLLTISCFQTIASDTPDNSAATIGDTAAIEYSWQSVEVATIWSGALANQQRRVRGQ